MSFIRKHKRTFIFIVVLFTIATIAVTSLYRFNPTLVESGVGFVVSPIQKVFMRSKNWASNKIDFFVNMGDIEAKNHQLQAENERLTAENNRLEQVNRENEEMSKLLEVTRRYADYSMIGAQIIAMDPGNWYFKYTIDFGENKGLKKDMVVLSAGGLAGKVYEVGKTYAKVISLIDDDSAVSARSKRTGDTGFVIGDASLKERGLCKMDKISGDADIAVGDEITTGHLSTIYPPGITIGTVQSVSVEADGSKSAVVKPVVDFKHMEMVLIITQLFDSNLQTSTTPTPKSK